MRQWQAPDLSWDLKNSTKYVVCSLKDRKSTKSCTTNDIYNRKSIYYVTGSRNPEYLSRFYLYFRLVHSSLWALSDPTLKDLSVLKVACRVRVSFLVFMRVLFSKCSLALETPEPGDGGEQMPGPTNRFWINNWGTSERGVRDYQIFHTFCRPSILFCMIFN